MNAATRCLNLEGSIFFYPLNGATRSYLDLCPAALGQKHIDDLPGTFMAKKLSKLLLVVVDLVFPNEFDEILRRIACQC